MSILTTIGGIPLFSTQTEALAWAAARSLQGTHTHLYQGQTGYMGGSSHSVAANTQGQNGANTPGTNNSSGNTGGY